MLEREDWVFKSAPLIEGELRRYVNRACDGDVPASRIELETRFLLLAHLLADLPEPRPRHGLAGWQLRRSEEFLRDHLAEDVLLAEVAAQACLSPFHFARQFKATMGLPPAAYQRKLRLEKAQELLLATDLEIGEIAATVGYETPQAFARAFRQAIGASPSDWRRERRR